MESPPPSENSMAECLLQEEGRQRHGARAFLCSPLQWFQMLAKEMHWSFVYGVVIVNGISQGLGGAICRVASDYYWKDVQRLQPSEAQVYQGITSLPWIVKPFWGLLTDVIPVAGYRRRPYFILAGLLGAISMFILWLPKELGPLLALLLMTAGSAGMAMADVTIDACIAENSISNPSLAADMQSLCGISSSIGGLLGFSISGQLMNEFGSKGVLGLLSIPATLVLSVGMLLKEIKVPIFSHKQICGKLLKVNHTMWATLKRSDVWRPCIFMFTSLALSLSIQEGMFYWYTDTKTGPSFSQGTISFIYSIGSVGSLLGVMLYQNFLKEYPFRGLLFWSQMISSISGMLDLVLVLRLNLKLNMPDRLFVMIDESVSQMIGRIRWMPLLVLSAQLCPSGIEGTFFALLMSIDHIGMLISSWGGGLLLQALKVSRTEFDNLWIAILIRNVLRIVPLALLHLVPKRSSILKVDSFIKAEPMENEADDIEQSSVIANT
ncbi:probable folate-biopterin transporter 3 [Typha angustifolia]|uniref:probable folate-biopterin transporter 3 n=1 Tax=Typha angustifolia TaxID=59011 RepID=UPI003C2E06B3